MSIDAANMAQLTDVLSGVDLGTWDWRIVNWIASYEPSTVTVLCGLVARTRQAAALTGEQLRTVLSALEVAADARREAADTCSDCDSRPETGLCGTCYNRAVGHLRQAVYAANAVAQQQQQQQQQEQQVASAQAALANDVATLQTGRICSAE